jgi:hypothetical protein
MADTLYIANATTRNLDFHYRIPEVERLFNQEIPAGQQWQLPESHRGPEAIAAVIGELERFGAIPRAQVGRNKKFSGIIFDHKPVSIDSIRQGFADVEQAAIDKALEERTKSVIAADDGVAKLAQEAGTGVGSVELEVIQEMKPGDDMSEQQRNLIQVAREGRPVSKRSQEKAARAERGG